MKSTNVPSDVYEDVKALDGDRCAWCAAYGLNISTDLAFHHRLPRARARNLHDRMNGVMLCGDHHRMAHAENAWPWMTPGSMLRGEYIGSDLLYDAVYNGAPMPTVEQVAADMDATLPTFLPAVRWAVERAQHARAAGVGRE